MTWSWWKRVTASTLRPLVTQAREHIDRKEMEQRIEDAYKRLHELESQSRARLNALEAESDVVRGSGGQKIADEQS